MPLNLNGALRAPSIALHFIKSRQAFWPAFLHLIVSFAACGGIAWLVFFVWYPYPLYGIMNGRELFCLLIAVDVACGPLITLIVFNNKKSAREKLLDFSIIGILQIIILGYGLLTIWNARPAYMVLEIDRFKLISTMALEKEELAKLPKKLSSGIFSGPLYVVVREPKDRGERQKVLFESIKGGRDYGERAEFYEEYNANNVKKYMLHARSIDSFVAKNKNKEDFIREFLKKNDRNLENTKYFPVVGGRDWILLVDEEGGVLGFFEGDGFQ